MKRLIAVALLALGTAVSAQSTASKKELVAKVLQLQQPAIERAATMMAERPAALLMQQANVVMQTRIPPDKRAAIAKDLQSDLSKYLSEAVPLVRERAIKLAPSTIGVVLEEKFTEEELKQLIAIFESLETPVHRKYRQLGGDMEKALGEKLGTEMRGVIDPKVKALDQMLSGHLGIAATSTQGAASGPARAPARAASK
jgi:uncharacterized protein